MKRHTAKFYEWAQGRASGARAPFWMGTFFFLEIFLFLPLDALFIFFSIQNPKKTFTFALIAVVASTLSGLIGYEVGHLLWDAVGSYIVPHWIGTAVFEKAASNLQAYESGAVFLGALLPFPLKILSLTAGVFHLNFLPFLGALLGARFLRFFAMAIAVTFWGDRVKSFLDRHFQKFFVIIGAKVALAFTFLWAFAA